MDTPGLLILFLLVAGAAASAYRKKLTPAAALTGLLLGYTIYAGAGYTGLILLALFFVLGTAATAWKKKEKLLIKGSAAHQTTRHAGQVFANASVAALAAAITLLCPAQKPLCDLMLAASLASATADTLSSELGMVYGRRNVNILTWKRDERGLDGVISLEGTLVGIAGSALIAATYLALAKTTWPHALIVLAAGIFGNFADSYLGATLERKSILSNDAVNFLNTLLAALFAGVLIGFHR
jgi:uncharacterized protein (TIGR00297 family)